MFTFFKDLYYRWLWKQTIKSLRDGFGAQCEDYDENCISCRALRAIMMLQEAVDNSKWFYKQE